MTCSKGAEVTIGGKKCSLSLLSLRYHKKMFQPGLVVAKVQVRDKSNDLFNIFFTSKDKLVAFFMGNKKVSLTQTVEKKGGILNQTLSTTTHSIAKDYYTYQVEPEYKRDGSEQYADLTLYIYSPDHKLTLDRYCKTYVNKKLCGDILFTALDNKTIDGKTTIDGILKKAGFTTSTVKFTLHTLNYYSSDTAKEFIQPYLVQYNESFYDLIARTANRCGEFFFYENGNLYLGLPPVNSTTVLHTTGILSYRYKKALDSLVTDKNASVADVYVNTMEPRDDDAPEPSIYASDSGTYFSYDELPVDEYLGMLFQKDQFADYGKMLFKDYWFILIEALNNIMNQTSIAQMLAKLTEKYAEAIVWTGDAFAFKNKKGNEKWVVTHYGEEPADSSSKDYYNYSKKDIHKNAEEQYDSSTETATLYGSMLSKSVKAENYDFQQNLDAKFYQFIAKCSHSVEQTEVTLGPEWEAFSLGSQFFFDGANCIVTEVQEVLKAEADDAAGTAALALGQQIVLTKQFSAKVIKNKKEETMKFFCPPAVVPFVRKSGPQRAFIASAGDPEGFRRVCIRYPWQKESETPSPWIRMVVPFAPNNAPSGASGFNFEPSPGDEVLVDYENGNMEHPYVVGSLYTRRCEAPKGNRSIVSSKGHTLSFNDGGDSYNFVAGVLPAFGLVSKFHKLADVDCEFKGNDSLSGGITLTDKWGMYKIEASSTERKIDIKSPFGNVNISAFSGITISAPNGDISIKGKNVSIEAGNEVRIVSGKFIDEKKFSMKTYGKEYLKALGASATASFLSPLTDLSLLRTVWEALLKPVAGTMTIQSGRYLLLTAGGGKVEIPSKGYSVKGMSKSMKEDKGSTLLNTLRFIDTMTNTWFDTLYTKYEDVRTKLLALNSNAHINNMTTPDHTKLISILFDQSGDFKELKFANGYAITQADADVLCTNVNSLKKCIREIYDYAFNVVKIGPLFSQEDMYFMSKLREVVSSMKENEWPDFIIKIVNKTETFNQDPTNYINKAFNGRRLKRMLAKRLIEKTGLVKQLPEPSKPIEIFEYLAQYLYSEKWKRYVDLLGEPKSGALKDSNKKFVEQMIGLYRDWGYEPRLWDTCKQGEILMSDKGKNETINIVNGVLTRTTNSDYVQELKDVLRNF
ncbi:MAG: hypothetical protein J5552_06115 [Prevotella sp.]|nr:hypothetical protein [Prevotella sp.]